MDAVEDVDPLAQARDMWALARSKLRRIRQAWAAGDRVATALAVATRIDLMERACALDPRLESLRRPHQRVGELDLDSVPAVTALLRSAALERAMDAKRYIDASRPFDARTVLYDIELLLRAADVVEARAQSRSSAVK